MDKLESFFIRTVTAAQQQAQPTSGAVSTTKIGDFLTQTEPMESILDKLVSSPISQQGPEQAPATEEVAAAAAPESGPDQGVLSKLTRSPEPSAPERLAGDQKVQTESVEPDTVERKPVKQNILDELARRSTAQDKSTEKTDKNQAGDSGDA
jgi:hypothetical protein